MVRKLSRPLLALVAGLLSPQVPAGAASFVQPMPGEAVVGQLQYVASTAEDTLADIARRNDVGYDAIVRANPEVDSWLPEEGSRVLVPTRVVLPAAPREGIVVNVAERRLYYYPEPASAAGPVGQVFVYPVSIGRIDWQTPVMRSRVVEKVVDPVWFPPQSIRVEHAAADDPLPERVPPGAENPLGRYALRLDATEYLIHGTNKPYGIGMRVTHGCVRLYPEDIEELFAQVPVGTPVRIIDQPFKAGWQSGVLYLEAHAPPDTGSRNLTPLVRSIVDATQDQPAALIDWQEAMRIAEANRGIPQPIGSDADTVPGREHSLAPERDSPDQGGM